MTKTGVMICGHGSRSQSAVHEFATLGFVGKATHGQGQALRGGER